MTSPKKLAALTLISAAIAAAPAIAEPHWVHVQTKEVSINGFDLSDRDDASEVLDRIERAAKSVCTISQNRQTVRERQLRNACIDDAVDRAVQSLKSPTMASVLAETRAG